MATTYGPEGIQVLTGVEAIRSRPGMYIGGTDTAGLHYLLWEVVGNSIDQHLAKRVTSIAITIEGMLVTVRDDGPGIPVELHRDGRPILEHVMTTLHVGATFDNHYPHVHLRGDHGGVGLVVTNALSSRLDVETTRDGARWAQSYERGKPLADMHEIEGVGVGTSISFVPDTEIFGETPFDHAVIATRLTELAHLLPRLQLTFQGEPVQGSDGLIGWATEQAEPSEAHLELRAFDGDIYVEVALAWRETSDARVRSFVNLNETQKGTHVDALWDGLVSVLAQTGDPRALLSIGLVGFVHVTLAHPRFGGPTRAHLLSPEAGAAVDRVIREELPKLLERDDQLRRFLLSRTIR